MKKIFIGIDFSKEKFDASLIYAEGLKECAASVHEGIKRGRCSNDPFSGFAESRLLECFVIIVNNFFIFYPYYSYVLND